MSVVKHNSHLTAIGRSKLPAPTWWAMSSWYFRYHGGHVLDFGCGRCHPINIRNIASIDGYDPYYRPEGIPKGRKYDTILCNYVLNTIPNAKERKKILRRIKRLLSPGGKAFIAVRNNAPPKGWGKTSKGTYQVKVRLPFERVHKTSDFITYMMRHNDKI